MKRLPITQIEEDDLKSRIFNSIESHKRRKRRILYAAISLAASIAVIIGLNFSFYDRETTGESIIEFANSSQIPGPNKASDEVTLILGDGKNLKIDDKITSINYSNSGEDVTIGSTRKLSQQSSRNSKLIYNTLVVPYGKRAKIRLSDQTMVWLNSGSKLIYPIVFNGKTREIYLEGEAIFDVTHDKSKPFLVMSQNQTVEVLGTVFSVTNYLDENSINTVLKTGSVQILYNNSSSQTSGDKIKINPGTIASYDKTSKSIKSEKVNVDNYFSWREGVLIFKNNDLQFIMKRLSRYYNKKVEISSKLLANKNETYSGYLDLNDDLETVIKSIQESSDIEYKITAEKIIIK